MLEPARTIGSAAVMLMAAYGIGRPLLRAVRIDCHDALATAVWSTATGLVAGGLVLTMMGFAGWLYEPPIRVLSLAACFWGVGEVLQAAIAARERAITEARDDEPRAEPPWGSPPEWLMVAAIALAGVASSGALVSALAPPTAGDALCYHLELPKLFLAEHALVAPPYDDNATYPLLVEMWYLWALALDGGVCAQLVHWSLGVLFALATTELARGLVGLRWGVLAGVVVLLVPGVTNQMTAPLNDVGLAAFTTLAVAAWRNAVDDEHHWQWAVVCGFMLGAALGIKYVALLLTAAMGVTWLWAMLRQRSRRRHLLRASAIAAEVAIAVAAPWYVRAVWHHGNPVYPFFSQYVGQPGPDVNGTGKVTLGWRPLDIATAPWTVTMHPERFGGRGQQVGAFFLAVLPGLLVARRLRGLRWLLAVALLYGVLWYALRQNVRFLYPLLPMLAVPAVWVWIEWSRGPRCSRWTAQAAAGALLIVFAAVPWHRAGDKWSVAVGLEKRDDYLMRREPTYRAASLLNLLTKGDARLLSQDYRAFYFDGRVTRESIYRRASGYDRRLGDPSDLPDALRARGFTHLLLAENTRDAGIRYDPTLSRLVDAAVTAGDVTRLRCLTEYYVHDTDGAIRRYRLMSLR